MKFRYELLIKKDLLLLMRGPYLYMGLFASILNTYLCFSYFDGGLFEQKVLNLKTVLVSQTITIILYVAAAAGFLSNTDKSLKIYNLYNSWELSKEKMFYYRSLSLGLSSIFLIPWLIPSYLTIFFSSSLRFYNVVALIILLFLTCFIVGSILSFFSFLINKLSIFLSVSMLFCFGIFFGGDPRFLSIFFKESIPTVRTLIDVTIPILVESKYGIKSALGPLLITLLMYLLGGILFNRKKRFS